MKPGSISQSVVSSIDLASTDTQVAGLEIPETFEGQSILSILQNPEQTVRNYAFGEDHWHDYEDHARAIVDGRWKLIRNDYNDLPATASTDAGRGLTWQALLKLKEDGKLNEAQLACFKIPRPKYELYDLENDPQELNNLVNDTSYAQTLEVLLVELKKWSEETSDYIPTQRTPDEFDRVTGEPDHSVRKRPRPNKKDMFGAYGEY